MNRIIRTLPFIGMALCLALIIALALALTGCDLVASAVLQATGTAPVQLF